VPSKSKNKCEDQQLGTHPPALDTSLGGQGKHRKERIYTDEINDPVGEKCCARTNAKINNLEHTRLPLTHRLAGREKTEKNGFTQMRY
jgi:hypothetical protein